MGYRGFYVKNVALLFCERIDKILKKSFATVTILVREKLFYTRLIFYMYIHIGVLLYIVIYYILKFPTPLFHGYFNQTALRIPMNVSR